MHGMNLKGGAGKGVGEGEDKDFDEQKGRNWFKMALTFPSMASFTSMITRWSKLSLMMAILKALPVLSLLCQCLLVFAMYVVRMWSPCRVDMQKGWHSMFQKNLKSTEMCFLGQLASGPSPVRCIAVGLVGPAAGVLVARSPPNAGLPFPHSN